MIYGPQRTSHIQMKNIISEYFSALQKEYASGKSTEHSFRSALKHLLEQVDSSILATNEPRRMKCGAPDFILERKGVPIGFGETKDIGMDLDATEKTDQLKRYLPALSNFFLTDYLEFRFYLDEEKYETVRIGVIVGNKLVPEEESFEKLALLLKEFTRKKGATIKSAARLARLMADKARLMKDVMHKAVTDPEQQETQLHQEFETFKKILLHDLTEAEFADMYAQTIAYGLFVARFHDDSPEDFSRQEAQHLVPKSNPFLRWLFQHIAGPDLDDRIAWIVDALAEVFTYCDVKEILKDFGLSTKEGKEGKREDPILHFYETFLKEYDPKLRKSRGVYYTPEPVVSFIVRSVDQILKKEFGLKQGLVDTSKVEITREQQGKKVKEQVHRVQILDPAAGTGTFLNYVIKQMYVDFGIKQQGLWQSYVDEHLLPRLHGFELMMAPYTMCHLKLGLTLQHTGYKEGDKRIGVYLTNSLEEPHQDHDSLFATHLSQEISEANVVKKDLPIMVVLGNPPYSGISSNKGEWITNLIEDYKYIDGEHFGEKKHWLQDDYVKFIRLGEQFVEKNKEGVLAFITNHGYVDNPTFRGMRWHLMQTFDKLFILDLHGNSLKKEKAPDGSKDENVFDIQQGVAIIFGVKVSSKNEKDPSVQKFDLYGTREDKYNFLWNQDISSVNWDFINPQKPNLLFEKEKDSKKRDEYLGGIKIDDIFDSKITGILTARDNFVIDTEKQTLEKRVKDFCDKTLSTSEFQRKYSLKENYQWKCDEQRQLISSFDKNNLIKINYRPFDDRYIYYDDHLVFRSRKKDMMNMLCGANLGLILSKRVEVGEFSHIFVTSNIIQHHSLSLKEVNYLLPLRIYNQTQKDLFSEPDNEIPNFNKRNVANISSMLKLTFVPSRSEEKNTFCPEDILDYIYAILHCPIYREKYKEFLKIDFPRVPFPEDSKLFWKLVKLGTELRQLHLLESPKVDDFVTTFPVAGDNTVEKPQFEIEKGKDAGKVWINDSQYFDKAPKIAWEFYIGGYQPAQKWLKDRKGRQLSTDDLMHYQRFIVAMSETAMIMEKVDEVVKDTDLI